MCSIGEQKALLVRSGKETWIYDYPSNTWSQIPCETPGFSSDDVCNICQMSKNRALVVGTGTWIFDVDSMRWFKITMDTMPPTRHYTVWLGQVEENLVFRYAPDYGSWYYKLDTTKSFTSNQVITVERAIDMPYDDNVPNKGTVAQYVRFNKIHGKFVSIPPGHTEYSRVFYLDRLGQYTRWINFGTICREKKGGSDVGYVNIVDDVILDVTFGDFYFAIQWDSIKPDTVKMPSWTPGYVYGEQLTFDVSPSHRTGFGFAKIKDSVAMLFGGLYQDDRGLTHLCADTWIFRYTGKDGIIAPRDNNDISNFHSLGSSVYYVDNVGGAELFDTSGSSVAKYGSNPTIDMNEYGNGVYFVSYIYLNKQITIKIIKN
jgi:hypothetical protein